MRVRPSLSPLFVRHLASTILPNKRLLYFWRTPSCTLYSTLSAPLILSTIWRIGSLLSYSSKSSISFLSPLPFSKNVSMISYLILILWKVSMSSLKEFSKKRCANSCTSAWSLMSHICSFSSAVFTCRRIMSLIPSLPSSPNQSASNVSQNPFGNSPSPFSAAISHHFELRNCSISLFILWKKSCTHILSSSQFKFNQDVGSFGAHRNINRTAFMTSSL